ncbi:MAG: cobalt-precorrin-7 (C(5))-methyltransferase [Sulfolobales archaeon]
MLFLVGVGPGDPGLLTLRGLEIIRRSVIIGGWSSVLERFSDLLSGKVVVRISYSTEERDLSFLVDSAANNDVSILIHGDPSVSDWQFVEKIRGLCLSKKIPMEIVPGVSSVNVALAREGLDLANTIFVSLHRSGFIDYNEILRGLALGRVVVVFPEPYPDGPQRIARFLIKAGFEKDRRVRVYEKLTFPDEVSSEYSVEGLANEHKGFSDLSVVIIYPDLGKG